MHVLIPFISLKLENGREIWVDAYFSRKLDESFRIASLVRSGDSIVSEPHLESGDVELEPLLSSEELKKIVEGVVEEVNFRLSLIKSERGGHYAKWNLLRLLFIPFGWSKRIREDEIKSSVQRELTYSKEILETISSSIPLGKIGYFRMEIVDDKPVDRVYRKLYEIDSGFRKSFDEALNSTSRPSNRPSNK
jgi:hypothetical protein